MAHFPDHSGSTARKRTLRAPARIAALLALLTLLTLAPIDAVGQGTAPYSTVSLNAGPFWDVKEGFLHTYWLLDPVGEAFLSTPFQMGQLELGVMGTHNQPRTPRVPAYDAIVPYAAWDIGFRLPHDVRWAAGPRLGMLFMDFDVPEELTSVSSESEVVIGAHARVTVHPLPYLGLYVGASYMQTFTFVRVKLYHVSSGIVLTIRSPRWLIGVLR